ncbi:MAG: hypothetical protein Q7T56_12345 [Nocardioidaceae bacterium]|nr:hypothetical protein [Nocardioidaceae bacterium]
MAQHHRQPDQHTSRTSLRAVGSGDPADAEVRRQQRELFALVLRSEPSRRGTPYRERTVGAYLDAVDSLGRWLDDLDHPGGYDNLSVHHLNAYLTTYLERHSIGGLVTKQGNLRVFLAHLVDEHGTDDLWGSPKRPVSRRTPKPQWLERLVTSVALDQECSGYPIAVSKEPGECLKRSQRDPEGRLTPRCPAMSCWVAPSTWYMTAARTSCRCLARPSTITCPA